MTLPRTLTEKLARHIEQAGPISVAEYMNTALGDPEFGYYMSREPFGRDGDFTTAPEISQMFGELVGLWAAQVWLNMESPENVSLVELGPGRGTLMADIMRTLAKAVPALHDAADIHLVEMSPQLRQEQKKVLKNKTTRPPTWHDGIDTLPDTPMIIIANEFFDALPVHQYVKSGSGWHERLVGLGADGASGGPAAFGFCLAETPIPYPQVLPQDINARIEVETIAETRPEANTLMQDLGNKLGVHKGAALIIDYGHARSGFGDTFQAVKNHMPQHVLFNTGEADLTAHVDFAALITAAVSAGLETSPVVTQKAFLKALGIETRAEKLMENASAAQSSDIKSAFDRLTGPQQMGSLFKVLSVYTSGLAVPPGFEPEHENL